MKQALQYEPKSVKALYHLAQLYRLRDDFDLAHDTLDSLVKIVGKENHYVNREMYILKKCSKAYANTRRDVSKKMFSFSTGENEITVEGDSHNDFHREDAKIVNEIPSTDNWIVGSNRATKKFVQTTKLINPAK